MRKFVALLAAGSTALVLPNAAFAEEKDSTGAYVSVNAGIAALGDPSVTYYDVGGTFGGTGTSDTAETEFNTKNAASFGGAIGYDFGMIRTDVELQYSKHTVESITFVSINGAPVTLTAADRQDVCDYLEAATCGGSGNTFTIDGARVRQLSAMGNVWVDLPVGVVTPYVGGGLGISGFEIDGEGKGKFAWQLGAGVAFNISENIALTGDYRHREVSKTRIEWDASSGVDTSKLKTDSFTAGLRFKF